MSSDLIAVAAIVLLFFFSIVLAAAETAFLRMSRIKALALEEQGEKRAGPARAHARAARTNGEQR